MACLEEELEDLDAEIVRRTRMTRFQNAFALVQTLPGIGELSAAAILAETGTDVASFPTAEQMASWAGLCPGNRESAGIQKGGHTTHGEAYLRTALVRCAWSAARTQGSVFEAQFQRLVKRLGPKRAIVAAHTTG
jgi:transposase